MLADNTLFCYSMNTNKPQPKTKWNQSHHNNSVFACEGNRVIHQLTSNGQQELRVCLEDFSGQRAFAQYSSFSVGSESDKFRLRVSGYNGTAGEHTFIDACFQQ